VFHEYGDDDVDEHELRHQDEDDEEDGSDDRTDAAVVDAVVRRVAVVTQRVLCVHVIRLSRVVQVRVNELIPLQTVVRCVSKKLHP